MTIPIAERKLQPTEIPHQLYVQNYSTASSTCLCVKRWLFSIDRELDFPPGEQASTFIFYQVSVAAAQQFSLATYNNVWLVGWILFLHCPQAVDEVNRGNIRADGRLYELKALQDARKAPEYLQLARTLPGYGDVVFPHCACDSRKEGHVLPAVGEWMFVFFLYFITTICDMLLNISVNAK